MYGFCLKRVGNEFEAEDITIETFAVFAVIAEACPEVIVVVSPARAVVDVVPKARLEVPAPINERTSAAVTPDAKEGLPPPYNTAAGSVLVAPVAIPSSLVFSVVVKFF